MIHHRLLRLVYGQAAQYYTFSKDKLSLLFQLSSERAKLVERVLRDLSDSTPELGVEGGKDSTPELGVEGGKDSTPELGVERGKDSTPELGVEKGKDSTPELGVERDKDSTSELSVEGGKGTMPRLDKEESIVAELLRRDFKPDVICNWPSSLRKLLDFSRQGDIAVSDLAGGVCMQYMLTILLLLPDRLMQRTSPKRI